MVAHRTPPPPPPDPSVPPRLSDGFELVDTLYTPAQQHRCVIYRHLSGNFRVRLEHWDTDDWESAQAAFWCPDSRLVTFADCHENAIRLAQEKLRDAAMFEF